MDCTNGCSGETLLLSRFASWATDTRNLRASLRALWKFDPRLWHTDEYRDRVRDLLALCRKMIAFEDEDRERVACAELQLEHSARIALATLSIVALKYVS